MNLPDVVYDVRQERVDIPIPAAGHVNIALDVSNPMNDANAINENNDITVDNNRPDCHIKWTKWILVLSSITLAIIFAIVCVYFHRSDETVNQRKIKHRPSAGGMTATRERFTLESLLDNRFEPRRANGSWYHGADASATSNTSLRLLITANGSIVLHDVRSDNVTVLVEAKRIDQPTHRLRSLQLSADARFALLEHRNPSAPMQSLFSLYRTAANVVTHNTSDTIIIQLPRHLSESCGQRIYSDKVPTIRDVYIFGPRGSQVILLHNNCLFYYSSAEQLFAHSLIDPLCIDRPTMTGFFAVVARWLHVWRINAADDNIDDLQRRRPQPVPLWFSPNGDLLAYLRYNMTAAGNLSQSRPDQKESDTKPVDLVKRFELRVVWLRDASVSVSMAKDIEGIPDIGFTSVGWVSFKQLVVKVLNHNLTLTHVRTCHMDWPEDDRCSTVAFIPSDYWLPVQRAVFSHPSDSEYEHYPSIILVQPSALPDSNISWHLFEVLASDRSNWMAAHQPADTVISVERVLHWSVEPNVIFYLGSNASSPALKPQRHLYSQMVESDVDDVPLSPECLTCSMFSDYKNWTYFDVDFAGSASDLLVLESLGPAEPRFDVFRWSCGQQPRNVTDNTFCQIHLVLTIETNAELRESEEIAELPKFERRWVKTSNGSRFGPMRAELLLPYSCLPAPDEDGYLMEPCALLVLPYAGRRPSAGVVDGEWRFEWPDWLALNRSLVLARVLTPLSARFPAVMQIGRREMKEAGQINEIVRYLTSVEYNAIIDPLKIGILGDGYASFVSALALEVKNDYADLIQPVDYRCASLSATKADFHFTRKTKSSYLEKLANVSTGDYFGDSHGTRVFMLPRCDQYNNNRPDTTELCTNIPERVFDATWPAVGYLKKVSDFLTRCLYNNTRTVT